LTEEQIASRKLSLNATFVVDIDVDLNVTPPEGQCLVSIFVVKSLLDAIHSSAVRPTALKVLEMEIMDAVLEAKAAEIVPSEGVAKGSLLERLLSWAGGGKDPMAVQDFADICSSPDRRRAFVQHRASLTKTLEDMK